MKYKIAVVVEGSTPSRRPTLRYIIAEEPTREEAEEAAFVQLRLMKEKEGFLHVEYAGPADPDDEVREA